MSGKERVDPETERADEHWMRAALALAGQGVGLASPNPTVGCVLVRGHLWQPNPDAGTKGDAATDQPGRVVGRGFHQYAQRDHAEVIALREAAETARGSTAYVTLEPCSHHGRTGPCAQALIAAGVVRVVVATADPNPLVNGQGIRLLREAGIPVRVGVLESEARTLNNTFARFIRTRTPFVTLKAAATLDGRIAPARQRPGAARAITGEAAHAYVQELRHGNDALLTGVGTVIADDPLLSDRSNRRRRRPLQRIVLDSALRLPLSSRLVQSTNGDVTVFTHSADVEKQRALSERGVEVVQLAAPHPESGERGIPLAAVLAWLGERQVTSVLLEGGSHVNASALQSDVADRLLLFYAPFLLGSDALPLVAGAQLVGGGPLLQSYSLRRFGVDFAVDGLRRDPWA